MITAAASVAYQSAMTAIASDKRVMKDPIYRSLIAVRQRRRPPDGNVFQDVS